MNAMTLNLTAFTDADNQNLLDLMVSVQFVLAIGGNNLVIPSVNFFKR